MRKTNNRLFYPQSYIFLEKDGFNEEQFIPSLIIKTTLCKVIENIEAMVDELSKITKEQYPQTEDSIIKILICKTLSIYLITNAYKSASMEDNEDDALSVFREQNPPCEICGENRTTDRCHIIPRKKGGSLSYDNTVILCPTHHRLFDRFMLSKEEYTSLNFAFKSKSAQHYIEAITLKNHILFWDKSTKDDYSSYSFIPSFIDKIPLYIKIIENIKNHVDELSKNTKEKYPQLKVFIIRVIIYKILFTELESKFYKTASVKDIQEIALSEYIKQNPPCEICGEYRTIDRCHIIPRKFGGTLNNDNTVLLCPTHHRLFDRFMLSKEEYATLNWSLKSKPSQYYIETITLNNHKLFWDKIAKGEYSTIPFYEQFNKEWNIYKYTLEEILNRFIDNNSIRRTKILKDIDSNLKLLAKQLIKFLLKQNILAKDDTGRFLSLMNTDFDIDQVAKECWAKSN